MRAQELMVKHVLSCQEGDSMERAAHLMWEGDIGALPVVDDAGRVIGMITDRDICMAAYTQGCSLAAASVGNRKASKNGALTLEGVATSLARIGQHRPPRKA